MDRLRTEASGNGFCVCIVAGLDINAMTSSIRFAGVGSAITLSFFSHRVRRFDSIIREGSYEKIDCAQQNCRSSWPKRTPALRCRRNASIVGRGGGPGSLGKRALTAPFTKPSADLRTATGGPATLGPQQDRLLLRLPALGMLRLRRSRIVR
jgi:hypothetical protein